MSNILVALLALYMGHCAGLRECGAQVPGTVLPDSAVLVLGPQTAYPTPLHAALWAMVRDCLGLEPTPVEVMWVVADTIVADPSGAVLYGIVIFRAGTWPTVVVQRTYWLHPSVIGHEFVHLLGRVGDGRPEIEACTPYTGQSLPARHVTAPQLAELRERGAHVIHKTR